MEFDAVKQTIKATIRIRRRAEAIRRLMDQLHTSSEIDPLIFRRYKPAVEGNSESYRR
jgi:hypothetical protein